PDDRPHDALVHHPVDRRADLAVDLGLAHHVGAPPGPHHLGVSQEQSVDLHLRDRPTGEANDDHATVLAQRAQAVGEPLAADGIQHHVHATARALPDLLLPSLPEEHDLICTALLGDTLL